MQVTISQIDFVEIGDTSFQISFILDGKSNLNTNPMLRSVDLATITTEVIRTIRAFIDAQAADNYEMIKSTYEGQTIQLEV